MNGELKDAVGGLVSRSDSIRLRAPARYPLTAPTVMLSWLLTGRW